jgi:hypothetical protein
MTHESGHDRSINKGQDTEVKLGTQTTSSHMKKDSSPQKILTSIYLE